MDYPLWQMLILLCVQVVFALLCGIMAQRKGYSRLLFTILGFCFFLVTAAVVLILPAKAPARP